MTVRKCIAAALLLATSHAFSQDNPNTDLGFENIAAWEGLSPDTTQVKEGKQSGLWADTVAVTRVRFRDFPMDASGASGLKVWAHSEKATNAVIAFVLVAENNATEGSDYYFCNYRVDWEGWKELEVTFAKMKTKRTPAGFNAITELKIASTDYECGKEATPGTVLRFDDMRFIPGEPGVSPVPPPPVAPPAATISSTITPPVNTPSPGPTIGFEDLSSWIGLTQDTEDPKEGRQSGLWADTAAVTRIVTKSGFPRDVSAFEGMTVWVHSEKPNGSKIGFVLMADNDKTEDPDYYNYSFPITWSGWQQVRIPFSQMKIMREPLGFGSINEVRIVSEKYGVGTPIPGTKLKFDLIEFYGTKSTPSVTSQKALASLRWEASLSGAIAAARTDKRLVFVGACGPQVAACQDVEEKLYKNVDVADQLAQYSLYRFDPRDDVNSAKFFKVLKVPTLLVYTPDGAELLRLTKTPDAAELALLLRTLKENNPVP